MSSWLVALAAAAAISFATTPLMRRIGLRLNIVDAPAAHKIHRSPVPYLGGIAIILATALGLAIAVEPPLAGGVALVVATAAALGVVGLVDDLSGLGALVRLAVQVGAAAVAIAAGVQLTVTGVAGPDAAFTLVWIVALTNAFNMADNMDGLSGGIAITAGGGVVALAALSDLPAVAATAGALTGAAAGYLVWNLSPRRIFMGDAGSMFVGYLLAVAVTEVAGSGGSRATSLVAVALLAGVLLLDMVTVVLGRHLHGRSVGSGGKDHLSHRLVTLGLPERAAVGVLAATQAGLSVLAVALGRGAVAAGVGLAAGLAIAGALAAVTVGVPVYSTPLRPRRRRHAHVALAILALLASGALFAAHAHGAGEPGALVAGGPRRGTHGVLAVVAASAVLAALLAVAMRVRTRVRAIASDT